MSVISFANPKGGSGKTTLCFVTALKLASLGAKVAYIDADPNRIVFSWAFKRLKAGRTMPFEITPQIDEEFLKKNQKLPSKENLPRVKESEIISLIRDSAERNDFVFIDLEGTASRMLTHAISRSHLVLIPLNPSPIDAECAADAVRLVFEESQMLQRTIPFRLVYSRFPPAVITGTQNRISKAITEQNFPILPSGLVERASYRDIFEYSKTLDELYDGLPPTEHCTRKELLQREKIDKAQENALELTSAIIQTLKGVHQQGSKMQLEAPNQVIDQLENLSRNEDTQQLEVA